VFLFCLDLSESCTDDASSPQKGRLLIDTTYESGGTSTEVDKPSDSASETDVACDWTELAGLTSSKKSQPTRATQVYVVLTSNVPALKIFLLKIAKKCSRSQLSY